MYVEKWCKLFIKTHKKLTSFVEQRKRKGNIPVFWSCFVIEHFKSLLVGKMFWLFCRVFSQTHMQQPMNWNVASVSPSPIIFHTLQAAGVPAALGWRILSESVILK